MLLKPNEITSYRSYQKIFYDPCYSPDYVSRFRHIDFNLERWLGLEPKTPCVIVDFAYMDANEKISVWKVFDSYTRARCDAYMRPHKDEPTKEEQFQIVRKISDHRDNQKSAWPHFNGFKALELLTQEYFWISEFDIEVFSKK